MSLTLSPYDHVPRLKNLDLMELSLRKFFIPKLRIKTVNTWGEKFVCKVQKLKNYYDILIYYRRFLCFLFPRDILKCPWHFIFEICHGHFIGVTGTLLKIETGKKKCHEQTVKKVTGSCYGHFCIFEINHGNTKNCHGYN